MTVLLFLLLAGAGLSRLRADAVAAPVAFASRESDRPPRLVLALVQQAQDTSRPPMPSGYNLPSPVLTVAYP